MKLYIFTNRENPNVEFSETEADLINAAKTAAYFKELKQFESTNYHSELEWAEDVLIHDISSRFECKILDNSYEN